MTAVNVRYAAFLEKYHPLPRPAGQASGTRHTDCHPHARSFSFNFLFLFGLFYFGELADCSASMLDTQVLVSLCALLWRPWKLVALFCHLSDIHPISFIFQTQGYCQYAQLPPCVCMCVCVRVCVYI